VQNWDCHACQELPYLNASVFSDIVTGTNGYVGYDPFARTVIVAFAGTDPLRLQNWIDDLNFIKTDYPNCEGCKVHKGFYNQYSRVQTQIVQAASSFIAADPKATLQVTGHSMGAALSVLCGIDLQHRLGKQVETLYNYGLPRVGNAAFATYAQAELNLFRLTHNRDPVPHLPTESMGFRHPAFEVFYNEANSAYKICDRSTLGSSGAEMLAFICI